MSEPQRLTRHEVDIGLHVGLLDPLISEDGECRHADGDNGLILDLRIEGMEAFVVWSVPIPSCWVPVGSLVDLDTAPTARVVRKFADMWAARGGLSRVGAQSETT